MSSIIRNNLGELEIDPFDAKDKHERWIKKITNNDGSINFHTFEKVSPKASELITKYTLDLTNGKNLAKGQKKGRRSFNHLFAVRNRLSHMISILETTTKKELMVLKDDAFFYRVYHKFNIILVNIILYAFNPYVANG